MIGRRITILRVIITILFQRSVGDDNNLFTLVNIFLFLLKFLYKTKSRAYTNKSICLINQLDLLNLYILVNLIRNINAFLLLLLGTSIFRNVDLKFMVSIFYLCLIILNLVKVSCDINFILWGE